MPVTEGRSVGRGTQAGVCLAVGLAGALATGPALAQATIELPAILVRGSSEDPKGLINGYVATRSIAGTKTDTPLMETPQAISVVGREQIQDQKPGNLSEALRYAPGVRGETYGADTRNDWFMIRGFPAQDVGNFLDGLVSQPLHFGDYGGMTLKLIWAVLDLVTIGGLVSGLYLWLSKGARYRNST